MDGGMNAEREARSRRCDETERFYCPVCDRFVPSSLVLRREAEEAWDSHVLTPAHRTALDAFRHNAARG